jgi:phosphatidate cytidylyltransferase
MSKFIKRCLTAFFLIILCIGLYSLPVIYSSLFIAALIIIMLTTEWPRIAQRNKALWLLTPLYPILPSLILIALNQDLLYRPLLGLALVLAATHDTGSYVIGSIFGGHLIAPTISPLKTWEGFFGGVISTMIVFMAIIFYWRIAMPWYIFLVISCVCSVLAYFGDLFESWLKRKAGIKDSGVLLPGHGGILDRIDSVLFVATWLYLCRNYLRTLFT